MHKKRARKSAAGPSKLVQTDHAPLSETSKHSVSNVLPMNKLLLPPPSMPLCGA
jgi:hypothetical protein